jgi:hypothetical protein
MPNPTPKRTPEFVAAVRQMREAGASYGQISRAMGCSVFVIRLALTEGAADASRHIAPEKVTEIVRLALQGVSVAAIVSRLRVSEGGVRAVLLREIGADVPPATAPSGGGDKAGGPVPAVAPNSMEASLMARGMPPEAAAETVRAWRKRRERPVAAERPVKSLIKSSGPFKLGASHAHNMPETSR